jgi:hypothetical protein
MWIFSIYGFYSVSAFGNKFNVRARDQAHLIALQKRFPSLMKVGILTTPDADYRYRITVARSVWVKVATELAGEQDWSNFKNKAGQACKYQDRDYLDALHDIWEVMYKLQEGKKKGVQHAHSAMGR